MLKLKGYFIICILPFLVLSGCIRIPFLSKKSDSIQIESIKKIEPEKKGEIQIQEKIEIPEPEKTIIPGPIIKRLIHDGVGRILKYGDILNVLMEGEPGNKAHVRIKEIGPVELMEDQPGIYKTDIPIDPGLNLIDTPVIGVLENTSGGKTELTSSVGLLQVDNKPPDYVKNLIVDSGQNQVLLRWSKPEESDIKAYQILVAPNHEGFYTAITETTNNQYLHKNLQSFKKYYYRVRAIDNAHNFGRSKIYEARPIPDIRMKLAKVIKPQLPNIFEGTSLLTTKTGNFYLNEQSEIPESGVVIIEPGLTINVGINGSINVKGELQIYGDKDNPVVIKGENGVNSYDFLNIQSQKTVNLRGLKIINGSIPIIITGGQPKISHCKIINSRYSALEIKGTSNPVIQNTEIIGSNSGGVVILDNAQPIFENNIFQDNKPFHIQSGSSYLIQAKNNTWDPPASKLTILGDIEY